MVGSESVARCHGFTFAQPENKTSKARKARLKTNRSRMFMAYSGVASPIFTVPAIPVAVRADAKIAFMRKNFRACRREYSGNNMFIKVAAVNDPLLGDDGSGRAELRFQEAHSLFRTEHENGGGKHSGQRATRREDTDSAATVIDGIASANVQDMPVAPTVDFKSPDVIARSSHRAFA